MINVKWKLVQHQALLLFGTKIIELFQNFITFDLKTEYHFPDEVLVAN